MRIAIVGSVAAGASGGAEARRNTGPAEIVIHERDSDISCSGPLPMSMLATVNDRT